MTLKLTAFAAALAITGAMALDGSPASAQSWRGAAAFTQAGDSHVQNVRHRRWHRRHHGYYRHGYYYRRGWGPALGGFAAGAIIGGALAAQQAQGQQDWIEYCSAKYRSFDPASGTYLGYDGERHACR
jgi:hypothetical protein